MKQFDFIESAFPNRKKKDLKNLVVFVKTQTCRKRTSFESVRMDCLAALGLSPVSAPSKQEGCECPRGYCKPADVFTTHPAFPW